MPDPLGDLLRVLDLTDTHARTSEDIFIGESEPQPHGRVFGGQVLAQSLIAAQHTIPDDRFIHSMHGYFLRPGDDTQPITFSVDRIHDGRSFATRRIQAYQTGLPILSMIASFQDVDEGLEHQIEMPAGLPDPESLPSTAELLGGIDHPAARAWAFDRAFDIRHIEAPIYLSVEGERVASQGVWMKTIGRLPDDPHIHTAALAYASDYTILEPIFRRHGLPWSYPGLKVASLDHAMWFHRHGRADEWVLYTQESPTATGGRGLALGKLYSHDGRLLASVAQEGTIRLPSQHESQR